MRPEELLDQVVDYKTFLDFLRALAAERESAEEEEREQPSRYGLDGAHGWKNGDISGFLYGCVAYFSPSKFRVPEHEASWKVFATVLYFGKIVE